LETSQKASVITCNYAYMCNVYHWVHSESQSQMMPRQQSKTLISWLALYL